MFESHQFPPLQHKFLLYIPTTPFSDVLLKHNNLPCLTFLQGNGEIGCVMLGLSCTFATFQLVE